MHQIETVDSQGCLIDPDPYDDHSNGILLDEPNIAYLSGMVPLQLGVQIMIMLIGLTPKQMKIMLHHDTDCGKSQYHRGFMVKTEMRLGEEYATKMKCAYISTDCLRQWLRRLESGNPPTLLLRCSHVSTPCPSVLYKATQY